MKFKQIPLAHQSQEWHLSMNENLVDTSGNPLVTCEKDGSPHKRFGDAQNPSVDNACVNPRVVEGPYRCPMCSGWGGTCGLVGLQRDYSHCEGTGIRPMYDKSPAPSIKMSDTYVPVRGCIAFELKDTDPPLPSDDSQAEPQFVFATTIQEVVRIMESGRTGHAIQLYRKE
jgi:hypothetical protein